MPGVWIEQGWREERGLRRVLPPLQVGPRRGAATRAGQQFQHRKSSREDESGSAVDHMLAASLGEMAACVVRVPTEVVKQHVYRFRFIQMRMSGWVDSARNALKCNPEGPSVATRFTGHAPCQYKRDRAFQNSSAGHITSSRDHWQPPDARKARPAVELHLYPVPTSLDCTIQSVSR